jgi:hypothetical protein
VSKETLLVFGELLQIDHEILKDVNPALLDKFATKAAKIFVDEYLKPSQEIEGVLLDNSPAPSPSLDSIYFVSLSRVSRSLSHSLGLLLSHNAYEPVLEFLMVFSGFVTLFPQFCSPVFAEFIHTDQSKSNMVYGWKYLKAILFSSLLLTEHLSSHLKRRLGAHLDEKETRSLGDLLSSVFKCYHSLHFITIRFGVGGLPLFENQIGVYCAMMVLLKKHPLLVKHFQPDRNEQQTLETLETNDLVLYFSNVSFYLQLMKHCLPFLESKTIEQKILPYLWDFFVPPIQNSTSTNPPKLSLRVELRDLSHMVCLTMYSYSFLYIPIIDQVTIPYIQLVVENINNRIDLELAREIFKGVIKGLSDFSPSVKDKALATRFQISEEADLADSKSDLGSFKEIDEPIVTKEWKDRAADLAWECVQVLVFYIHEPPTLKANNPVLKNETVASTFQQSCLLLILFDQISIIAFSKLVSLLNVISELMLDGFDGDGFGIVKSKELSPLWNSLFDCISEPNRVDYSRRYDCVVWYLDLYDQASQRIPSKKGPIQNLGVRARL